MFATFPVRAHLLLLLVSNSQMFTKYGKHVSDSEDRRYRDIRIYLFAIAPRGQHALPLLVLYDTCYISKERIPNRKKKKKRNVFPTGHISIDDYKKNNMSTDMEKAGKQKGKSDNRITESKARQKEALHCAHTKPDTSDKQKACRYLSLFTKQRGLRCAKCVDILNELVDMAKAAMYTHKEGIIEGGFARVLFVQKGQDGQAQCGRVTCRG
jgi:hypothetical protein